MQNKHPVALLKKKVLPDAIMYKFKWNNGAISLEPMTALTPEMLVLVQEYELKGNDDPKPIKQIKTNEIRLEEKKIESIQKKPREITVDEVEEIKGHKPRKSRACTVKSIRNDGNKIDFQVIFEDDIDQKFQWLSQEEMKIQAPVGLCEFLLAKVKWGANSGKK